MMMIILMMNLIKMYMFLVISNRALNSLGDNRCATYCDFISAIVCVYAM
jgi:hypothetical protein